MGMGNVSSSLDGEKEITGRGRADRRVVDHLPQAVGRTQDIVILISVVADGLGGAGRKNVTRHRPHAGSPSNSLDISLMSSYASLNEDRMSDAKSSM